MFQSIEELVDESDRRHALEIEAEDDGEPAFQHMLA